MRSNRLSTLMLQNKGVGQGLRLEAAQDGDEATLYVYDVLIADAMVAEWIGGVAPEPFVKELHALDVSTIHVRINSPGGDVFAARPIEQALREHPARIVTHVDGYAASAATLLAVVGDEVRMSPGGFFMVHNSWTFALGNAEDLMATAELLDKVDGSVRKTYQAKTGADEKVVRAWMDEETWFTADEAKDAGFIDLIDEGEGASARAWNLSAYTHAPPPPAAALDAYTHAPPPPAAALDEPPEPTAATYNLEHMRRRVHLLRQTA